MVKFLIAIVIFVGMIFPTQALCNTQIESQVVQIYRDYGVRVLYQYDRDQYFDNQWKRSPVNAQGEQISEVEIIRLLPIIREFLSFYPKEVIVKNIKNIYLVKELTFYGSSFGASNSNMGLYIKSQGSNKGFTDQFLLGTMHSEFSSILMRNYAFPEKAWKNLNLKNFQYIGQGKDIIGSSDLYAQIPELLSRGFICKYAQASVEEDFNMMVYWLFAKPNELKVLAKKYPIINSKMWMVIDFYQLSVDSRIKF
jgi:hypothetical protein